MKSNRSLTPEIIRRRYWITVVLLPMIVLSPQIWAAEDSFEHGAEQAKAAYLANPNADTRAVMDRALEALEASIQASPAGFLKTQVIETPPNNTPANAQSVTSGDSGVGTIDPAADIDFWVRGSTSIGDLIFAYVDTAASPFSTDSQLNIFAHDTTTLIEFDDDDGQGLSSCAAGSSVPQTGDVYFRINEFLDDGTINPYELLQDVIAPAKPAAEVEGNDTSGTATAVSALVMTGSATGADVDFFSFSATAGDRIAVIMDDDPDGNSDLLDTELEILYTDGSTVLATGDNISDNDSNCAGVVVSTSTGTHFVRGSDGGFGGADTAYRFVVIVNETAVPVELMSFAVD